MGITKWYEIVCDGCGNAEHFQGCLSIVQKQYKDTGGIVGRGNKYYCSKKCQPKREVKRVEACESCGRDLSNESTETPGPWKNVTKRNVETDTYGVNNTKDRKQNNPDEFPHT